MEPPLYFGKYALTLVTRANLPHWSQRCACFVTFRLADSLPQDKLAVFVSERETWLAAHPQPWDEATAKEYFSEFDERIQLWLDKGCGACVLAEERNRCIVENALRYFADQRYSLYAFVVMPNHVHVLFMPMEGWTIPDIVQGWKSYSARLINARLGCRGSLWQKESWDHLVRNVAQFNAYRDYIVRNCREKAYDAYRSLAVEECEVAVVGDAVSRPSGEAVSRPSGEAVSRPLLNKDITSYRSDGDVASPLVRPASRPSGEAVSRPLLNKDITSYRSDGDVASPLVRPASPLGGMK